jgi:hypothetical protein
MTRLSLLSLLAASAVLAAGGSASAVGGMGDASAHLKEMNALCDLQRRGELAREPDLCLPEYPPGPVERQPWGRGQR